MQGLSNTRNALYRSTTSLFDYCRARCRTSSASIVHKQYRSPTAIYCFGSDVFEPEMHSHNTNTNTNGDDGQARGHWDVGGEAGMRNDSVIVLSPETLNNIEQQQQVAITADVSHSRYWDNQVGAATSLAPSWVVLLIAVQYLVVWLVVL
jgi:hypothetical protein